MSGTPTPRTALKKTGSACLAAGLLLGAGAPRDDPVAAFLTGIKGLNQPPKVTPSEELRLNTKIAPAANPNRLGVLAKDTAGFPNGRRLTDDVVDIELQALEGAVRTGKLVPALAAGDGVNTNDVAFGDTFPYVAMPHSGSGTCRPGQGRRRPAGNPLLPGGPSQDPRRVGPGPRRLRHRRLVRRQCPPW